MVNQTKAARLLLDMRQMPIGWDYGRGAPLSGRAYAASRVMLNILVGLGADDFDILPGAQDSAVIIAYMGDKSAEISCSGEGSYELLHEIGDADGKLHTGLSLEGVVCCLENYGWKSPKFYASCTQNAMYQESEGTAGMRSKIRATVVGYRLSARPAFNQAGRIHVITYHNSTKNESAETHQSSGEYQSLAWEKALA